MTGTIAAIERDLTDGGLVRRMPAKGNGYDEGVFLVCSCWLADCMAKQGRQDERGRCSRECWKCPTTWACSRVGLEHPERRTIARAVEAAGDFAAEYRLQREETLDDGVVT